MCVNVKGLDLHEVLQRQMVMESTAGVSCSVGQLVRQKSRQENLDWSLTLETVNLRAATISVYCYLSFIHYNSHSVILLVVTLQDQS